MGVGEDSWFVCLLLLLLFLGGGGCSVCVCVCLNYIYGEKPFY